MEEDEKDKNEEEEKEERSELDKRRRRMRICGRNVREKGDCSCEPRLEDIACLK